VLALAGMVFADQLVWALASDYAAVPGKLQLTALLARIMLPTIAFIALAAAAMGMLNALHHFFIPALAPATFNVATILCAILLVPLAPRMGLPAVAAIAIGTLLGAAAQFLIQWPALQREGFRYRPLVNLRDPALQRVLVLMGPGRSALPPRRRTSSSTRSSPQVRARGRCPWLNYAFRLMYLPIGLFGVSIATAVLPAVSRRTAHGR
jgi:putative peptidoglycan lipid II flippase